MQAALDRLGTSSDPLRRQLGKLLAGDLAGLAEPVGQPYSLPV